MLTCAWGRYGGSKIMSIELENCVIVRNKCSRKRMVSHVGLKRC